VTPRAWWLPGDLVPPSVRHAGGVETPEPSPALIMTACRALGGARAALAALPTDAILRAIDAALAAWQSPDSPGRRAAEAAFHAASGVPAVTAPFAPLLDALRAPNLRDWLRQEVKPVEALERLAPGSDGVPVRARGPRLALHVLPANVPLAWLPDVLACLLLRTPCLLKPGRHDPLTAPLFARSLAAASPAVGNALAVVPWPGGDEAIEAEALGAADAVIVWGGERATTSLARRATTGATLVVHGPQTAAAAIGREMAAPGKIEPLLALIARDALLYDGRGCLSPAEIFFERGGLLDPAEVAPLLAKALTTANARWPAGIPDPDAAALIWSWRARVTARRIAGKPATCVTAPDRLDWTVLHDDDLPPLEPPLPRTIRMTGLRDVADLPERISGRATPVAAVALALPEPRRRETMAALAGVGITRICPVGTLQSPPVTWANGGASPFQRLLRWSRAG
jgi:hypothetical protein